MQSQHGLCYTVFTSACVSMAAGPSSAGAASADAVSSVCMGSSVELAAVLTPSVIDEIDWRETKTKYFEDDMFLLHCAVCF